MLLVYETRNSVFVRISCEMKQHNVPKKRFCARRIKFISLEALEFRSTTLRSFENENALIGRKMIVQREKRRKSNQSTSLNLFYLLQSPSRIVKSSSRGQINTVDKFHHDVTVSLPLPLPLPPSNSLTYVRGIASRS